jgi:predicted metalloprotease with PDZ domain
MPDTNSPYYFDGTSFLAIRRDTFVLQEQGPGFTNSNNQKALSREMRHHFFHLFADKDSTARDFSPYNLDDKRFWNTSVWEKFRFM